MGASRTIARAYKCALALGICIQLEIFFYTGSLIIFLDQINKSLVGANPDNKMLLLVGYSISTVCVAPWLYTVSNFNTIYIERLTSAPAGLVRYSPREQEDDVWFLHPERLVLGC